MGTVQMKLDTGRVGGSISWSHLGFLQQLGAFAGGDNEQAEDRFGNDVKNRVENHLSIFVDGTSTLGSDPDGGVRSPEDNRDHGHVAVDRAGGRLTALVGQATVENVHNWEVRQHGQGEE